MSWLKSDKNWLNPYTAGKGLGFPDFLGGKGASAPEMSAEEKNLLTTITGLVKEQDEYNKAMMPEYAHQMHYTINDDGTWVKMSDDEWYNSEKTTDSERKNWDIQTETQDRELKALRGELPLTESLQQQKQTEFEQMKSVYGISGNSIETATASDTIGTQNLSEFKKRWNTLEEQERYGQLQSGMASTIQAQGLTTDLSSRNIGTLQGIGASNSGAASGYYSLLNPFMSYNMAGYQSQLANQQMQNQRMGMGAGLLAAVISSKKYKTGIKTKTKKEEDQALKDITKTRSVEYKYKKGLGLDNKKHLGAITEEVPKSIALGNRTMINLEKKLELVSMGLKSLNRKVEAIS